MNKLLILFLVIAASAIGQVRNYTFTGVITSSDVPGAFVAGDPYHLSFDLDFSKTDSSGSINYGFFGEAVANLSFSLDPSAVGNYSGGKMSARQFLGISQVYETDNINFFASRVFIPDPTGLSFGPAGSFAFTEFGFNLYSGNQDLFDLVYRGNQTLAAVLPEINLSDFDRMANVYFVFDNWNRRVYGNILAISPTPVPIPEPSTYGAAAGTALILLVVRRKKREV